MKHTPIIKNSPRKITPAVLPATVALSAKPSVPVTVHLKPSLEEIQEISDEPTSSKSPAEEKEIVLHYFSGSLVTDSQSEDEHYDVSL